MDDPIEYNQYGVPVADKARRKRRRTADQGLSAWFFPSVFTVSTLVALLVGAFANSGAVALIYAPIGNAILAAIGLVFVACGVPIRGASQEGQSLVIIVCAIVSSIVVFAATFAGFHGC